MFTLKNLDRLINGSIIFLFFTVPLFFTSVNYELFEFNKMLLVYLFASFTFCLWLLKKALSGNWKIAKSPFDIFLLIFLASQAVSFFFSIDRHTSFFGYYSRFNGGLLSLIAYAVIYKVIADQKSVRLVKQLVTTSLIAGLIVSLYAILEHFGHSFSCLMFTGKFDVACWVQDVQNRVYATLGQPNWLAAYLIVLIPITWGLTLNAKIKNQKSKIWNVIILFILFIIYYACLLFTKSRSGFLGFIVSYFIFWSINWYLVKKQIIKPFLVFTFLIFIFTFSIGTPFSQLDRYFSLSGIKSHLSSPTSRLTSNLPPPTSQTQTGPQLEVGGTESGKIRAIVWKGALAVFHRYPLFGSGPETFAYSYYQDRPMEHNLVSEWDFLYNKAHNEYLNYLATTGAVGLGAYLLFVCSFVFIALKYIKIETLKIKITDKNSKNNNQEQFSILHCRFDFSIFIFALLSGFVGILVSNFFGFSVVISNLYLFTIPAMVWGLLQNTSLPGSHPGSVHLPSKPNPFVLLVIFSAFLFSFWQIVTLWRADYYYNQGDKLSKRQLFLPAYEALNKAVELNRSEPIFQIDLAFAAANLAVAAQTNQDSTTAGQLIEIATTFSQQAYQTSPSNLNLLKTRIKNFYALSLIDPQYTQETIQAILEAIRKAPTDPKLVYNLGLMYGKTGQIDLAIKTIEQSVQMKPNFADARNALAQYFETLGLYQKAIDQLEYLNQYINPNNQTVVEKINQLREKLSEK